MKTDRLEWRTERRRVKDLIPYERNPRRMTDKQAADLRTSLERLNLMSIPVIDTDGTIVSGHMRMKTMILLGRGNEVIDVRVPNRKLTPEEFEEANLRENKNLGEWDYDVLSNFSEDLLLSVGFDEEELVVGFGLSRAEDAAQDPDRYCLLTVEPPEAPRLKMRLSFHCDTQEEFEEIRAVFCRDQEGNELDKDRLIDLVRSVVDRA